MFFVWCGKGRMCEKCVISRGEINKEYKENYMLLNKFLGFEPENMKVKTEIVAGATTFFTMSYILAVNPMILSTTGMDKAGVFTATAIASAIATILLAFMAKLPFAQAPSMGLNAFFAFTLCQGMGFTWMSVGGCCPLCPRYLLVLLTLFATSKGFLCVVNSLDLFIRQHICIYGAGFERLVSHQFLGSLNVAGNRL